MRFFTTTIMTIRAHYTTAFIFLEVLFECEILFCGKETERTKMSEDLVESFGELSGYIQQYMFYYKTVEEKESR